MTLAERIALVASFREIVEDFISATNRRFYLNDGSPIPDDGRVETEGVAWTDEEEVLASIPESKRTDFLTVNIAGTEYWFIDGALQNKVGTLSLEDGQVTLAKMADMATASVIYRRTAGDGPPEVQSLATLRSDLEIPESVDVSGKVDKVSGSSLVPDTEIAKIHEPGSDNQDLTGYVEKVNGERMITEDEAVILTSISPVYTIGLPSGTVAERCAGALYVPEGWTIEEDENPNDLLITHGLGLPVFDVKVYEQGEGGTRLLYFNSAYSGLIAIDPNTLRIENLATIPTTIAIQLLFGGGY